VEVDMKKVLWMLILVMAFNVAGCSFHNDNTDYKSMYEKLLADQAPTIKDITFMTMDGKAVNKNYNWFVLDKQVKIGITLDGNCGVIDMFYTPAGTETYKQQRLIEEISPKQNYAEYVWNVPDDTMGYFNIIAYNKDVGRRSDLYDVISETVK